MELAEPRDWTRRLALAILVSAAVLALTVAGRAQPRPQNLLTNSDFELVRDGVPAGWRGEGAWEVQGAGPQGGHAMHLPAAKSAPWNKLVWTGYVEVDRGETIALSANYLSTTGDVDLGLEFCDAVGGHVQWCDVVVSGPAAAWAPTLRQCTITDQLWQLGVRAVRPYLQVTRAGAEVSYANVRLSTDRPPASANAEPLTLDPLVAGDLAPNPDFSAGAGAEPAGYRSFALGPEQPGQASWKPDSHALRLTAGKGTVGWRSDLVAIDPTVGYQFTAHVRTDRLEGATFEVRLAVHGAGPRVWLTTLSCPPVRSTTTPFDLVLPILPADLPPGAASVELRFVVTAQGAGQGDAWVQHVSLRPLPARLAATTKALGNVFHRGDPLEFTVAAWSYLNRPVAGTLEWQVHDFRGATVASGRPAASAPTKATASVMLRPELRDVGYYELHLTWREAGRVLAQTRVSLAVVAPFEERLSTADSPFGSHPHGSDPAMALAREGYIKWIRTGIGWEWVEHERGKFVWDGVDAMLKRYQDLGMEVLATVANTPEWASTYRPGMAAGAYWSTYDSYPPKDLADLEHFCSLLAQRYRGRIRFYEVWNEPNGSFFMGTREQFAGVLKAAYRGLKQGDPDCQVMFDAAGVDMDFYRDLFRFGAGSACDILAVHNYQLEKPGPPEATPFYDGYLALRKLLALNGQPDKPLWDSEFCWMSENFPGSPGWTGVGEANQARWLVRSYVYALAAGAKRLFWFPFYPYYDPSTSGAHGGSLVREDLSPKPAFVACRVAAQHLVGATFQRWIDVGSNARCAVFRNGSDHTAIVWSLHGGQRVSLRSAAQEARLGDLMGRESSLRLENRTLALTATEDAAYLSAGEDWQPSTEALAQARAAAAERAVLLCPPLLRTPVVDGEVDDWWSLAHPVGLNTELRLGEGARIANNPPLHDLSGEVALGTGGDTLYLGGRVTDDVHVAAQPGREDPADGLRVTLGSADTATTVELGVEAGLDRVRMRRAPGTAWQAVPNSVAATRRDESVHLTTYEAAVPLATVLGSRTVRSRPLGITLVDADGRGPVKTARFPEAPPGGSAPHGRLLFTWRPDPLRMESVYSTRTDLAHVRRIVTVFPPGAAYLYELWASRKPDPSEALDSGDWSLLVPARLGQGRVTDAVDTDARRFRTRFSNLLANSGFEQPLDLSAPPGIDRHTAGFSVWQRDQDYCTIDREVSHTGGCSAKIAATGRGPENPWSNWGQLIQVKPATSYSISGYVKVGELAPDAAVSLAIHGYPEDTQEQLNNRHEPAPGGVNGWQRLAFTVRTASKVTRLAVWCDVRGNGTAWFDDVQVIEGDTPTNIPEVVEQRFEG